MGIDCCTVDVAANAAAVVVAVSFASAVAEVLLSSCTEQASVKRLQGL